MPASRPAGPIAEGRAELLGRLGCQGGGESCGQHLGLGAGVCTQPAAPGSLDSPGCAQEACPPVPMHMYTGACWGAAGTPWLGPGFSGWL